MNQLMIETRMNRAQTALSVIEQRLKHTSPDSINQVLVNLFPLFQSASSEISACVSAIKHLQVKQQRQSDGT